MILLRPEWLLALPLLALAGWLLHRQRGGLGGWDRVADPRLLQAMTALGRVEPAPGLSEARARADSSAAFGDVWNGASHANRLRGPVAAELWVISPESGTAGSGPHRRPGRRIRR